jgi:tetratricopeptide (TPR) repeat protein
LERSDLIKEILVMLRILRKTFKTDSRLFLSLGSAFLQGSKIRHPREGGDPFWREAAKFAPLENLPSFRASVAESRIKLSFLDVATPRSMTIRANRAWAFRFAFGLSVLLLCAQAGFSLAEEVEYGPIAAAPTPTATKAKASTEIKGSEEYNKGCELFGIAKLQASKGNINGEKQLLKEAQKHFETALTENPKLVEAQSNIAFIALTLREYRRSIGLFEQALKINPHHVNSLNGLATAYALTNNIEKSIQTFDVLLKLAPGNSEFFFNKGSVLQKAGRLPEARRAYEEAIKVNPKNQSALFNLGTLMENQGNLTMAKTYYERARDIEIGNTAGLESLHRLDAINATLNKGK